MHFLLLISVQGNMWYTCLNKLSQICGINRQPVEQTMAACLPAYPSELKRSYLLLVTDRKRAKVCDKVCVCDGPLNQKSSAHPGQTKLK